MVPKFAALRLTVPALMVLGTATCHSLNAAGM